MPPYPLLGMVPAGQRLLALRTRPHVAGRMINPDLHSFFRHLQLDSIHEPRPAQTQHPLVQLRISHGHPPSVPVLPVQPTTEKSRFGFIAFWPTAVWGIMAPPLRRIGQRWEATRAPERCHTARAVFLRFMGNIACFHPAGGSKAINPNARSVTTPVQPTPLPGLSPPVSPTEKPEGPECESARHRR